MQFYTNQRFGGPGTCSRVTWKRSEDVLALLSAHIPVLANNRTWTRNPLTPGPVTYRLSYRHRSYVDHNGIEPTTLTLSKRTNWANQLHYQISYLNWTYLWSNCAGGACNCFQACVHLTSRSVLPAYSHFNSYQNNTHKPDHKPGALLQRDTSK